MPPLATAFLSAADTGGGAAASPRPRARLPPRRLGFLRRSRAEPPPALQRVDLRRSDSRPPRTRPPSTPPDLRFPSLLQQPHGQRATEGGHEDVGDASLCFRKRRNTPSCANFSPELAIARATRAAIANGSASWQGIRAFSIDRRPPERLETPRTDHFLRFQTRSHQRGRERPCSWSRPARYESYYPYDYRFTDRLRTFTH